MVYQNKVAVAIKCHGKVLRERDGVVTLPFGSEYGVLIKNMHSCRILAKLSIDGKDTADGQRLIIEPNSSVEIRRYIRNGNLSNGNAFKFVERTSAVEESRGITVDDGFVRVEFWLEHVVIPDNVEVQPNYVPYPWSKPWWPYPSYPVYPTYPPYPRPWKWVTWGTQNTCNSNTSVKANSAKLGVFAMNVDNVPDGATYSRTNAEASVSQIEAQNDTGITVPGSVNHQKFSAGPNFRVEDTSHVLVLRLRGKLAGEPVEVPLTVKTDLTCSVCYKTWPGTQTFCGNCGAALILI